MNIDRATALAQEALIWLAARPDDLAAFLAASGADAGTVRVRAGDPEFLGFVLDFVLGSDEAVRGFAADAGIAPETVARTRAALPGGAVPDWT